MTHLVPKRCPCGSGLSFDACCRPYHQGERPPSPEALMRSRYSAFALSQRDYLLATWHATTRPPQLPLDPETQWMSLVIVDAPVAQNEQLSGQPTWVEMQRVLREGGCTGGVHMNSTGMFQADDVVRFCTHCLFRSYRGAAKDRQNSYVH